MGIATGFLYDILLSYLIWYDTNEGKAAREEIGQMVQRMTTIYKE
jgi:meiotically up-regulated gene 157 (Mug157) protein